MSESTPVMMTSEESNVRKTDIAGEGDPLELNWTVTAEGYHLRSTTNLMAPDSWENIDAWLIQTDGLWRASLSLTNTVRFFQLQSP